MAGIGWRLERLIHQGISGATAAYVTGAAVMALPWALTTALLASLPAVLGRGMADLATARIVVNVAFAVAVIDSQWEWTHRFQILTGKMIEQVFHRSGKPIRSLEGVWRVACDRAGVGGKLLHDLRRTRVRELERAGVARSVAMALTGHKTESIYRLYAIVSEADLGAAMEPTSRSKAARRAGKIVSLEATRQ